MRSLKFKNSLVKLRNLHHDQRKTVLILLVKNIYECVFISLQLKFKTIMNAVVGFCVTSWMKASLKSLRFDITEREASILLKIEYNQIDSVMQIVRKSSSYSKS